MGRILDPGSRQFWLPIGVQKRLRKRMLYSMLLESGRSRLPPPPPLKFSVLESHWEGSGRVKQGKSNTPELPLTGSADDGKRSSLNVTFVRGLPRGKPQLTPSGYPKPVGSAG